MNPLGLLTLLIGFVVYALTLLYLHRAGKRSPVWLWLLALIVALPAAGYDLYYSRLLGEPIWLCRLRAVPGSEVLAAGAGLLAGLLQMHIIPHLRLSPVGRRTIMPTLLTLGLLLPHLKPVFRPLRSDSMHDIWRDGVCHQSTGATCGPASVATILRHFGTNVTECGLAQEAYTSATGTEIWYLARAIKRRGLEATFIKSNPLNAPLPALAGVKLLSADRAGHYISLLGRSNDMLVIADPLEGRQTASVGELAAKYQFTGLFLAIGQARNNDVSSKLTNFP